MCGDRSGGEGYPPEAVVAERLNPAACLRLDLACSGVTFKELTSSVGSCAPHLECRLGTDASRLAGRLFRYANDPACLEARAASGNKVAEDFNQIATSQVRK